MARRVEGPAQGGLVPPPRVVVQGEVPDAAVDDATEKLLACVARARQPVLGVELRMMQHADSARERPARVEMTVDLNGAAVRAHRHAPTMSEAIDRTVDRLARRLDAASDRPQSAQLRHRAPGEWRHDDEPAHRPPFFPRPPDERSVVRRKTFALRPMSIEEALFDLDVLDHGFFLFVHADTGAEAVVYRDDDGVYAIAQRVVTLGAIAETEAPISVGPPPPVTSTADAIELLDQSGAPFVFFVDDTTDRGCVIYRRYDGHLGMILPD